MVVSERYAELADSFVGGVVSISPSIGDLPSLTTTLPFVTPRQAAFILFTSGSTGTPKGIVMEHVNLCTSVSYAGVKMNFTSESRCLHFSSYAFDASIYEIFNTLGFGGCLCIISESDRMNNLAAFINSQRTNLVILTPSTATLLQPEDVPTVKTFIAGGEALTHDIVNTWADKVHLINGYGPAESTICCLGRVPSTGWKYGTIGPMVGGVGWIVDRYDHTKLAAVGAIGELVIEGPVVTRGYLDEPEKTAAAYIDTPAWLMNFRSKATSGRLYKSGDLVQYTHDGGIRFVGRMQGQVKLRGQRIELGEVEYHVKKAFPVTSDVVAKIVHPSGEGRKPFLVACVFVNDQTPDNSGDLFHESTSSFLTMAGKAKLEVSGSLPSYMVPEVFLPLRRLPLGATGKLDHRQLQEACSSLSLEQINRYSTEAQVAKRAPSTDIEKTLREVWARVLSIEESAIGVDDNWIRLGGDSLLAMRVVSQASAAGLKTSVEALFQGKTIAKMGLRTEYLHPNQRLVAEPVNTLFELTPMQRLFFDNVGSRYNQFYQSRSFRLSREVSPNTVKSAVRWVVENHSMLRARFVETSRGQWKQMVTNDTDRSYSYRESVVETPEAATALLEADQGDLDIREGPLFICHLLHHSPDKQLDLAFTAHRLVVDDASWKILSSDIDILLEGQQTPPPPSLPVQTWSRLQAEAAKTPQPTRTSNVPEDYWEINLGDNGSEDVIDDGFVLTEQVTQALLGNANDAFRTQPVEILHAAILQAFAHVFSDRAMPTIFTEDHDRDQQGPNSDFSRTVGWLSSMRPVDVSVQPGESFLDIVRRTKDARRNVTNDSWPGFTSSDRDSDDSVASPTSRPIEILFNYHTAYEDNKTSVLRPLARTSGAFDRATHKVTGLSLVDVAAHIRDSQLYICFIYNRQMRHGQSSIRDWINETRRCLESAPAILTVQQPSFTVSDFPLLAYSSSAMEAFNKTVVEPLLVRSLEIEDAFKCSPIQDGMLLSRAKEEGLYMHRFICQVKSSSDSQVQPEKLQAAWQKVMQRHPLLRALLYESPDMDGHYNQVVLKTAPPDMSIILPPSTDPVKELERYQFDMSPLTPQHRLAICASPSGQVQILVEIHHALTDGRSNQLLFHDLSLAYEERLDLTPVRAYRDYVRYIDAHPLYEATAFWEHYLRLVEPCNLLPSPPCPLPNQDKYVRQALQFTLPFGKELRNFCAHQGLTLANVFQLAWALVLRVYLNSESACFGYMISGRNLPIADIHDTIGPILNTHICSISIEETESILNLLHKCQADYVESLAHQHISMLDKIKSTGRSASSLFNTIMSVIPALDEDNDKSALIFEHSKDANPTEYDLALHLGVGAHEIIVSWEYVLAFMSHEQIENISDTFQQAILSIMSEPLQAVRDVDLFGPLAKQRVTQYNKKEPPALVQFPDQLIVNQCLAQPMSMSVDAWDGSFTYEQLNKMSDLVAAELRRCGVQPNRTVALCFDKSCWMPVAMLATLKAGGTFVALHASNPIERLREICDDAEISIALTSEQNRELAAQICSQVLVVDEGIIAWENRPPPPEQHVRNVEDIAYLIFTSGSSGKPKGVMVSHRAISTNGIANGHAFMMNASSRVFQFSSYAFDMNLLEQITALMMGACICIPSESQKHDIPKSVATFQANWVAFTPAVARLLNPSDLPTLRTMMVGGELVTEKELEAWRNHVNLFLGYGPTECTITVCSQLVTPEIVDGRTLGHCHGGCGWVVNPKYPDRLVPVGAIGELVIEGPVVATGYLNDPVKTATAFIESPPWLVDLRGKSTGHIYKTGDLVRFTDNGKILYLGRKDLQVKLRGNRIELGEVEARLRLAFPGIKDAVAEIVQPEGGNRQPMLMAFVLMSAAEREEIPDDSQDSLLRNPSSEFSAHAQLAESDLSKYLPVYMIPTVYLPIWYIPLTRNDKVDRKKIREVAARLSPQQLEAYDFSAGSSGTPTTTEEVLLQRVWAQLLNKDVASIGLHTNFFRMGGDSVLAMSMISQARNAGYSIKMADVFNHPKLASLAAALVHKTVANRSEIAPFALLKGKGGDESLINLAATQCGIPASSIEDIYPTTPLQEGLVALAAKQPGKYIVTMKHQLSEGVELEKFVAAWDLTVASNPILRTRVIESDSLGFLQVVVRDAIPWQTVDDEDAYEERISATNMGLGDTLIHFGISQRESGKQPEFYLTMHHAIYDGGSMPLLWKQVHSAYHGESLSPQPFNRFIEHILATEGADAFWKTEFDGLNAAIFPSLPSPVYVPDPSSSLVYTMSSVEHQAVNVTTATAIRLAWALVMACHTDSEDVVHGLTVNGRSAPMEGIEDITGPTFATFPVRTQVRRSDTVTEALASIQDKTVASMPFQQFGTQNIRQLNKDAARACDFQCHLAVQAPRINLANELVSDIGGKSDNYEDFASYALVVVCHLPRPGEHDIEVSVNYDQNIVETQEAMRMMQQFEHVLRQIELSQGNPNSESIKICDIDIISPEDKEQLGAWNSVLPPANDACLHELVLRHAVHSPDAPAISAWDGDMTFKELETASAVLAQHLLSLGLRPKSLVPLLFDRSKWVIVAMTALHRIGAAIVNIDPTHPKERIQDIVSRTEANFILGSPSYRDSMVFEGTTFVSVPIEGLQAEVKDLSYPTVSPRDVAFVIFTSGSTGKPKGILMEHVNIASSIGGYSPRSHFDRNTRGLHFASYAFDASIYEIFGVLINGGCICIPSEYDRLNDVVPFINKHNVTWAIFTPSYLTLLKPESIPSVRTIMLGGEAVTQENVSSWAGKVNLLNGYGPAEATICAVGPLTNHSWKQGTIGHVTGGVGWVVMPSDRSRLAPIGAPGELVIEGAVVTRSYLSDPEKTLAAYATDPVWLRPFRPGHSGSRVYYSGDIVQYNADGTIRYLGRADNQVKLRGQRIELGEVEHHVRSAFPNAIDVAAEVVTPTGGSPMLVAFVANMTESPGSVTRNLFCAPSQEFLTRAGEATEKISRVVPRYMVPAAYIPLSEIPRTSSDKANRRLLREEAMKLSPEEIQAFSRSRATARRQPETEQEKTLQSLWAQVFKVPKDDIGADDNFLNLGDSLAAIRLSNVARSQGLHLPVSQIFSYPILSEQARVVTALEVEYRPGSLLGDASVGAFFNEYLTDKVSSYKARDVEDILPSTEQQSAFVEMRNVSYSRVHLSTRVDPRRLEKACRALIRKHAILRTVFVPHNGQVLQVVLRNPAFQFKEIQCEEQDLTEFANSWRYEDSCSPVPFGSLHFQATLVSRSESDHMLILRLTHAQYDATAIKVLLNDLAAAYNGARLARRGSSFAQFMDYWWSRDFDELVEFWRGYLHGVEMIGTEMLRSATSKHTEAKFTITRARKILLPRLPDGITMTTLSKAAWAVVLARVTNTTDVVFGHVTDGRSIPLADVDVLAGPCAMKTPLRVKVQPEWTILELLNHVWDQESRSANHGSMDFGNIAKNATEWTPGTEFGSVVGYEEGDDTTGWRWETENVGVESHLQVVTSPAGEGMFRVEFTVSSVKMHPEDVERIMEEFCRVLVRLSGDVERVVPLENKLDADEDCALGSGPNSLEMDGRPGRVWSE
ncbi:hypothetical protein GGR50DRAFT_163740 [Xylaria sp. CBS 124048]|nr:hypothetical protein GGR50DRAFT_163740 [Xylaria sp. CBS 124048]